MPISDIIKCLPPFSDENKTIENVLALYGGWIDHEAKEHLQLENIEEIKKLIHAIWVADKHFQTGQVAECYKTIYDIIFSSSYSHEIVQTLEVNAENFFFRMRQCDNE